MWPECRPGYKGARCLIPFERCSSTTTGRHSPSSITWLTLPPERLNESVPGTAGPIIETMEHLVRAERLYQLFVDDENPTASR